VSVMGECDLDVMGAPSKLSVIRKGSVLVRARPTLFYVDKIYYKSKEKVTESM
jgi:hypothetical protein